MFGCRDYAAAVLIALEAGVHVDSLDGRVRSGGPMTGQGDEFELFSMSCIASGAPGVLTELTACLHNSLGAAG